MPTAYKIGKMSLVTVEAEGIQHLSYKSWQLAEL